MAWSIFSSGGGNTGAAQWARGLLQNMGLPQTPANIQFIYDWEVSEGGGGKYNPLNQGPVPGQPSLTTTGQQFGGGAADYASAAAGITGAADYLRMPAYRGVLSALQRSNYKGAEQALWASPWASSHYGYGKNWATQAPPGTTGVGGYATPGGGGCRRGRR